MAQGLSSHGTGPGRESAVESGQTFLTDVLQTFSCSLPDIRTYSPLALAFLGDAVYSLAARTIAVSKGNRQASKMHDETKEYVSAHAQAMIADAIIKELQPDEAVIYRRGLHANPPHHARNQTLEDYQKATALETLCGYLYLEDKMNRLLSLIRMGLSECDSPNDQVDDNHRNTTI